MTKSPRTGGKKTRRPLRDSHHREASDRRAEKKRSRFLEAFRFSVLIFLAEWGDRSMLATITLATTRSAFGVLIGGCCGHLVAGTLAVLAGHFLEEHAAGLRTSRNNSKSLEMPIRSWISALSRPFKASKGL